MMIAQHPATVVETRHVHGTETMMMANIANTISSGKQGCERIRIKLERLQGGKAQPVGCGEKNNVGNETGHKERIAPLLRQRMRGLREEFDQIRKTCEERISEAARSKEKPYLLDSSGNEQMDEMFEDHFRFEELERALFELNLALNEEENLVAESHDEGDANRNEPRVEKKKTASSQLEPVPCMLDNKFEERQLVTTHPKSTLPVIQSTPIVEQPNSSSVFLSLYFHDDNKWWSIGAFLGIVLFDCHGVLLVLFGCLWTCGLCLQQIKTK